MENILSLKNIYASYPEHPDRQVIRDLNLELGKGRILGLVGGSGSGKSTIAKVITGLLPADSGEILLEGKLLGTKRDPGEKKKIQMVFQNPGSSLNPRYKIGHILKSAMKLHFKDLSNTAILARCNELIERMELPADTLDRYPSSFSGGQKQRIALARALCLEPEILIADEPTSSLDVSVQLKMLKLIKEIQRERKLSILFITHDLGVVNYLCDTVAVLKDGSIAECSDTDEFFRHPDTQYGRQLLDSVPRI